jgi:hypothetical protein
VQCEGIVQIFVKQAKGDALGMTPYSEEYRDDFAPVCALNVLSKENFV